MVKWIKYFIGVAILAFLVWYLSANWESLSPLLKLTPLQIFWIYFVSLIVSVISSYVMQRFLRLLKANTSLSDMFMLQNAGYLLNYLPMKFGTVFRAGYLKHHYGLRYAHFGVFFVYLGLLMALSTSVVGFIALVLFYGFSGYETKILAIAFLCVSFVSIVLTFVPLPIPKGDGKFSVNLRNFLVGRTQVIQNKKEVIICMALFVLSYCLASVRLGIIYYSMGQHVHPAGYLVLGALAYVMMFVNITPGAFGIREVVLASGAMALGLSFEVGTLAAMIDRAIAIGWSFAVGGVCTAILWKKYPDDFKQAKSSIKSKEAEADESDVETDESIA